MLPSEYDILAQNEQTHWWFVNKQALVRQSVQQYLPKLSANDRILDIGCGTGAILSQHRRASNLAFGIDYAPDALKYTKKSHAGYLSQGSIMNLPVASNSVTLVTLLDVLYHQWITEDETALQEIYRVLKPNGFLILTDSAFNFLQGAHDKANLAARRYTVSQIHNKLRQANFCVKKESYVYMLLLPAIFIHRWAQRVFSAEKTATSDVQALPVAINQTLIYLLKLELLWLKYGNLPWGSSVLLIAKKEK